MVSLRCESKKHSKNKIKTQQTREYNKKESDSYREQTTFYGTGGNMGLGGGEWEAQTHGYKTGYKDILYNTGNITNTL